MLRFIRRESRPFNTAAQSAMRPYRGVLAELLYARGVDTAAQADAFLDPRLDELYDPLLLNDMQAALDMLTQARAERWPTVVYGDYDADGVCAATIATEALRRYGIDATPHVPLREEGYGLNIAAVEELAKTYQLLVTVDLGITNADEVNRAKELGMRVIVTDHHQPGLVPCPADAVVNPLLNGYPFPRLCGAGVAYKLACALLGADAAEEWLDLAALATVADIVPLLSENRVLVAHGLRRFGERPGLKALMAAGGCTIPPTSETVGYQIAPRLNAAGRIADAGESIRLLMTRDPDEAETLAKKLDAANTERKRLEAEATEQAEEQAKAHDFVSKRMLFVYGADWNAGVIGLVAGRLNRRYGVPVCALTEKDGLLHGSLRGVRGLNLAKCLQACDDLLLRYGGHEMAAGVTLSAENDAAFRQRLEHAVRGGADDDVFIPVQEYDAPLTFAEADDALLDALEKLQPFGLDNPAPVFYTEAAQLTRRRACGAQGAHLQLSLRAGARSLDGIAFGMGTLASSLPDAVDVAYTLAKDEFRGRVSIKCNVQALRPSAQTQALAAEPQSAFDTSLLRLLRDALAAFPADPAGNSAPDAEMIKAVHRDCTESFAVLRTAGGEDAPIGPLLDGRQGTLFVAYARDTAERFLAAYGDRVDLARRTPGDPRCFHTLLVQPQPEAITGRWKALVLLDGPLTPNGIALWRQAVPQAALFAAPSTRALRSAAQAVDAGDDGYRALYRLLRRSVFGSLRQAAEAAALTEAQTLAGLLAFDSLGLISFSEAPFHYDICEPRRCSLSDSPVLGALRALYADTEDRVC